MENRSDKPAKEEILSGGTDAKKLVLERKLFLLLQSVIIWIPLNYI